MAERKEWERHPQREVYRDWGEIERDDRVWRPEGSWSPERRYGGAGEFYHERGWEGGHYGPLGASYGGGLGTYAHGPFAGRGPKSYRRPDDRIREEVCERLTRHPDIDATAIDVGVKNGEVTLAGAVDSRAAKHLAEDLADGVYGVRDVRNDLRVHREMPPAGWPGNAAQEG